MKRNRANNVAAIHFLCYIVIITVKTGKAMLGISVFTSITTW